MAGPYTPPNPYGAYFSFGAPEGLAQSHFSLSTPGGFSPGTLGAMGAGSGGMNPTALELAYARNQEARMSQFMAGAMRGDTRTSAIGNVLLSNLFRNNPNGQNAFLSSIGGRNNMDQILGFILAQPGISGYLGGSSSSLGLGAYAMATSGMSVNGLQMLGDGPVQMLAAQAMLNRTRQQFFAGGGNNTSMTYGLNRDQIAGIQMLGASQGAFSGMSMGNLVRRGGNNVFVEDENSVRRMTEFTKNAARALSSIVDVFGSSEVGELFNKASRLTGLSFNRLGNANVMADRIQQIRRDASNVGMDLQSYMENVSAGVSYGQSLGLSGPMAGIAAAGAARQASIRSQVGRMANAEFFVGGASMQALTAAGIRDIAGMSRDPIGIRQMAINHILANGIVGGSMADKLMAASASAVPGDQSKLDALLASQGISLPDYITAMGGATGLQNQMSPESLQRAAGQLNASMQGRIRQRVGRNASRIFRTRNVSDIVSLAGGLDPTVAVRLLDASAGGASDAALREILAGDLEGRSNMDEYIGLGRSIAGRFGDRSSGLFRSLTQSIQEDPITMNLENRSALREQAARNRQSAMRFGSADETRQLQGGAAGILQGLLDKYSGTDPQSTFVRMMQEDKWRSRVAGIGGVISIPDLYNEAGMRSAAAAMRRGFGRTGAGRQVLKTLGLDRGPLTAEGLQQLHRNLSDELYFQDVMKDFTEIQVSGGSMFVLSSDISFNQKYSDAAGVAKKLQKSAKDGTIAATFGSIATALSEPTALPARLDYAMQALHKQINFNLLREMGVDNVKELAAASPLFGQAAADAAFAATTSRSTSVKTAATDFQSALADMNYHAKGADVAQKLTGSLSLSEDGTSLIIEGLLAGGGGRK